MGTTIHITMDIHIHIIGTNLRTMTQVGLTKTPGQIIIQEDKK